MTKKRVSAEERYTLLVSILNIADEVIQKSTILSENEREQQLSFLKTDREDVEYNYEIKNTSGLKQLQKMILTPWNEAYDENTVAFWKIVKEKKLDIEQIDYMDKILKRGRIANYSEYEFITDAIVIYEEDQKISKEEIQRLNDMIYTFETKT